MKQFYAAMRVLSASLVAFATTAPRVFAHASEQSFVLLLPTDLYVGGGVAAVIATVLLLSVLPGRMALWLVAPVAIGRWLGRRGQAVASCLSAGLLLWLVWVGFHGVHDPLENLLPLTVWTVFWIAIVCVQALVFDIWAWINPFAGPVQVLRRFTGPVPLLRLPGSVAQAMAILTFIGFACLLLADPAPTDPDRLAWFVGLYWAGTVVCGGVFGLRWLRRAEGFGAFLRCYNRVAVIRHHRGRVRIGLPGWGVIAGGALPTGSAVLVVLILGMGSFDGLNETYWWMGLHGINPFEFPGRSAVVWQNLLGMLLANLLLLGVVLITVRLGQSLVGARMGAVQGLRLYAPTLLPIALAYHIAHYLPSFLVEGQYVLVALSDPFGTGADLLQLGHHYVSTGFFNARDSVRVIFLTQAGAIVVGHMLAILLAHVIALRQFGDTRRAAISQAPMAIFMVAYTFFGLWLLASPRL